jgi:putative endonuclease
MSSTESGSAAERAVAEQLQRDGFHMRTVNWKTPIAEIDIVAERRGTIYFVEVKYRRTLSAGDGFAYITPTKLRHMTRAADAWVQAHGWHGPVELLAVAVTGYPGAYKIDMREI